MTSTTTARFTSPELPADKRYDPRYDPLVAADPGAGRAYAPTYWVATAGTPPVDEPATLDPPPCSSVPLSLPKAR